MADVQEVLNRLMALPEHLQPHNRRFYVEAVSDETRAPLASYYEQEEAASEATQAWAKGVGADGFYPPRGGTVRAFSFKDDKVPTSPAWVNAGRGYVERRGYTAKALSKRPAGKALAKEVEALPAFPEYKVATAHLGRITDLRTGTSSGGVGYSDGKIHFTVPFRVGDRFFISAVNHNYDIAQSAQSVPRYAGTENEKYAPSLDYDGDPIAWRPAPGWTFLTKTEVDFIIAEENMREAQARTAAKAAGGAG